MAEAEKVMSVSVADIEKIMGLEAGDIEKIMGVELPAGVPLWQGDKGITIAGKNDNKSHGNNDVLKMSEMTYRTISSGGSDSADWGDLINDLYGPNAVSNQTYICNFNGEEGTGAGGASWAEYVTVASGGGASYFGSSTGWTRQASGCSAATNGNVAFSQMKGHSGSYTIGTHYTTIGTSGSESDGGNLTVAASEIGAINGKTYAYVGGGYGGSSVGRLNVIDKIAFATPTDAGSDSGDLTAARNMGGSVEDGSRGIFVGGYGAFSNTTGQSNSIDYFAVASGGDAADFGDFVAEVGETEGMGNGTIGEFHGGTWISASNLAIGLWDNINYITIQSTGNAATTGAITAGYPASGGDGGQIVTEDNHTVFSVAAASGVS